MKTRKLPHTVKWSYDFNHSVERVWPLVSDTDRMNRAVGMSYVEYRSEPSSKGGSTRFGKSKVAGFTLEWIESPYEWVLNSEFGVHRDYSKGPLKTMDISWVIKPTDQGCRIEQTISFEAKNTFYLAVSFLQMKLLTKKAFLRVYKKIEKSLTDSDSEISPFSTAQDPPPTDKSFHGTVIKQLAEVNVTGDLANKLTNYIFDSPQAELYRIKPFVLAKSWSKDRLEILTALLRGTNRGVFSLSWDIVCPRCRGVKSKASTLNSLKKGVHCDSCNIDFTAQFDKSVEVTFSVHPRIRKIEVADYCVGGPQNTPHFVTQLRLAPKEKVETQIRLQEGIYRVRSLQAKGWCLLDVQKNRPSKEIKIVFNNTPTEEERIEIGEDAFLLSLTNQQDFEITVAVNQVTWMQDICTAAYVTSLQEFRNRFASEVLDPGQEISVSRMVLLFTDLKGSTKMYQKFGDAKAYKIVRNHFELLTKHVTENEGAIVKTLGDSVMASFSSPASAIRAALEIQNEFSQTSELKDHSSIKIGIHTGSCFIISSDGRLDYFGSNVNIAARISGQCDAGDIIITQYMMNDPDVKKTLDKTGVAYEKIVRNLKGFDADFDLYQIKTQNISLSKIS